MLIESWVISFPGQLNNNHQHPEQRKRSVEGYWKFAVKVFTLSGQVTMKSMVNAEIRVYIYFLFVWNFPRPVTCPEPVKLQIYSVGFKEYEKHCYDLSQLRETCEYERKGLIKCHFSWPNFVRWRFGSTVAWKNAGFDSELNLNKLKLTPPPTLP